MGSRVQKIAFIIFALLFVAIMAVMNTSVLNLGTNANKQLSTTLQTSDSSALEIYNNSIVSGNTVLNAAKNPSVVSSTNMTIAVVTKANQSGEPYTSTDTYTANPSDSTYINTSSQFTSHLVSNSNGVIVGIIFIQDGATSTLSVTGIFGDGAVSPTYEALN